MPKQLDINPLDIRKHSSMSFHEIPVNAYTSDIARETARYGASKLKHVYTDMLYIREFENLLDQVKRTGRYQGIEYSYPGPAHLSVGQESSSVGQCLELSPKDWVFGSHRSHGEILAKCFAAIRDLPETDIQQVLEHVQNGRVLSVVEKHMKSPSMKELAVYFILYTVLAEIFARVTGCNQGLGGSMHACFIPFGSMPNNAIVGGSADIALGAALQRKLTDSDSIVIANIGDAAMGCGPVWEALTFASMDQYHTLWGEMAGAPPFMLNVFNNQYGMGGQTRGETMGNGITARIAAGVNPEALHAERVDGFNPLAVADAIRRKKELLIAGRGPVLLDTITYRFSGHSPSDASSYRSKEELTMFRQHDCLPQYAKYLQEHKLLEAAEIEKDHHKLQEALKNIFSLAIDSKISPFLEPSTIQKSMYSQKRRPQTASKDKRPACTIPKDENPRLQTLKQKKRYAYDADGRSISPAMLYTYRDAVFEAMIHRFYEDAGMIAFGEENRDWGGAFACYRGLTESLPYHRLFNSPISEAAIIGVGVGYAMSGSRAVVELMYCDFLGRAGDEVFNQMPKWQSMSGAILEMPLVLRVSVGNKYGAQHSQDWSAFLAHIPGLKIIYPATPYDAKGLLNAALVSSDPVVCLESQKIYGVGEFFHSTGVPDDYYEIEIGLPDCKVAGNDITIVTLGPALYPAHAAVKELAERYSISAELIDLRSINPLDYEPIVYSLQKTNKILLVSDACERGSFMHTVASTITRYAFDSLDAPPVVIGSKNWISPPADLEHVYFPQAEDILDAIHRELIPLPGYQEKTERGNFIEQNKAGL